MPVHELCSRRPRILIGPLASDPTEAVTTVNRAFVEDLGSDYWFIPQVAARRFGATRQSQFNLVNVYYLLKHLALWVGRLAKYAPDIAHYGLTSCWNLEKTLIFLRFARAFGTKTMAHLHGGAFLEFWATLPTWRKTIAFRQLCQLDALVLTSEGWREGFARVVGLPNEKLFVVNNPIQSRFEKAALDMPVLRHGGRVLCLGIMDKQKGVWDILEAARLLNGSVSFVVQLVGSEKEPGIRARITDYLARHSISNCVEMREAVLDDKKIELFRDASIFLLPSYFENFPLVLIEAAAAGLPIVTTPVGAVPEFFTSGVSAQFVAAGNSGQIAQALRLLLDRSDERLRLGTAAREMFVHRLHRSKVMAGLSRVYQIVLNGHGVNKLTHTRNAGDYSLGLVNGHD